ncbi:hypothetical protein C8R46DRAFT_1194020 [Mycena filopes]|nr:hypothetical protein C8R46DRAFT_1194020 [Mycena filopes]
MPPGAQPQIGTDLKKSSPQRFTNDDLRARASLLDSEIAAFSALSVELGSLLTEREVVQEALDAISYPVLTLPFEITSQLFRSTLEPRDPKPSASSALASQRASLLLGHICRLWRQIALATPELWRTIDLRVHHPTPRILTARQALARTFLSRAGSSPLVISLYGDSDSCRTILELMAPYSRTWASISLDSSKLKEMEVLHSVHHQLPALTSLKLVLGAVVPGDGAFENMFSDAPLLRNVHLSSFGSQPSALPWSQLTSLTLDSCTGHHFVEILGWTPRLVHLIVRRIYNRAFSHAMPLPLPNLQSVAFGGARGVGPFVLSLLDAHVRVLALRTYGNLAPFSPPMLHPASLEQLSVDILPDARMATPPPSIEFLTPMSSLCILKIIAHDYDPGADVRFTHSSLALFVLRLIDDPDKFLPNLQSLTLILLSSSPDGPWEFDTDTLLNMLCVRFPRGLRHFELSSRRPVPALDSRATDLRTKGMQIILETVPDLGVNPYREEY